jgi:hypothetical protein
MGLLLGLLASPAAARTALVGPSATVSPVIAGAAAKGQTLTATAGTWAGDTPLSYAYQWEDCTPQGACAPIGGATGQSYVVQASDVGRMLVVSVTASNDAGTGVALSAPTALVGSGAPPAATSQPTTLGGFNQGLTLTIGPGVWSGDTPISYAYQWQRCNPSTQVCTTIPGATGSSYVLAGADVGFELRALVTATNDAGSAQTPSELTGVIGGSGAAVATPTSPAPGTATNPAPGKASPALGTPTISGSARVGGRLTATPRGPTTGSTASFAFQWQRCNGVSTACADIPGATGESYVPVAADAGAHLRVVVSAIMGGGAPVTSNSGLTTVVTSPPEELAPPTTSGTARVGHPLTAAPGSWNGPGQVSYAYAWERCDAGGGDCASLRGATRLTYTPVTADVGSTLRILVTVTGPFGSAAVASAPTLGVSLGSARADPYLPRALGVDVSFPNCGAPRPRVGGFVIVGLNGGDPFTFNPCFAREYAWAQATRAPLGVYLNTSYSRGLLRLITPACRRQSAGRPGSAAVRRAFALGCSEAHAALGKTPSIPPAVVWLDVETSNRWSSDPALNGATIQGMVASLASLVPRAVVGIYSNPHMWQEITGGLSSPAAPEWIPALNGAVCTQSFAGGPVWLAQGGGSSLDLDRPC